MWAPSRYIPPTKRKSTPQKFYDQKSFFPRDPEKMEAWDKTPESSNQPSQASGP